MQQRLRDADAHERNVPNVGAPPVNPAPPTDPVNPPVNPAPPTAPVNPPVEPQRSTWDSVKDFANQKNFTGLNNWQTGAAGLGLGIGAYTLYKMLSKKKQKKTASHVLHSMLRKEAGAWGSTVNFVKKLLPSTWAGGAAKKLEAGRIKAAPIATTPKPAGVGERSLKAMGDNPVKTNLAVAAAPGVAYGAHKGMQAVYGPNADDKKIIEDAKKPGLTDNLTSGAWWNTENKNIGGFKPWQAAAGIGAAGIGAYALAKLLRGDDE
jgi:hypothetical protein